MSVRMEAEVWTLNWQNGSPAPVSEDMASRHSEVRERRISEARRRMDRRVEGLLVRQLFKAVVEEAVRDGISEAESEAQE